MTLGGMNPGLQTFASGPEASSAGSGAETPAHKKLVKAAQEFEGILISQLLGDFKECPSPLGGDSSLAGSDTLNSLAIQTLSGALARRGGLGIGQILIHQLEPSLNRGQAAPGGGKVKTASRD
jgi:Rod binding domain-containing protein